MKNRILAIWRCLIQKIGYDRLSVDFQRYLCVMTAFTLATTLSNAYFNVFLLRATGSSMAMMWYNLLLACVQPFVMLFAAKVLRRGSVLLCLRIGLLLHAGAYLFLALLSSVGEREAYLISVLFSAGNAFYYTSYTPQILACTQDENRDTAYGATGLISTVIGIVIPLLTGFFITGLGTLIGYRILFAASLATMLGGVALSYRMTPVQETRGIKTSQFRITARRMFQNRAVVAVMLATLINALRVAGSAYYGSLLVYALLREEAAMGVLSTVCALIGLAANAVYGRIMTPARRGKAMYIGSVVIVIGLSILWGYRTAVGYAIYAVLGAVVNMFVDTPIVTGYMGVIQKDEILRNNGAEVHALREFFYAGGRVLGLLPVFFLANPEQAAIPLLMVIAVLQIPAAILVRRAQKMQ